MLPVPEFSQSVLIITSEINEFDSGTTMSS